MTYRYFDSLNPEDFATADVRILEAMTGADREGRLKISPRVTRRVDPEALGAIRGIRLRPDAAVLEEL